MEGRKSVDRNFLFGFPTVLSADALPTESDIVSHSLFVKKEKVNTKEWQHNTPSSEVATVVANDVCAVWDKTDIPHFGTHNPQWVKERVEKILKKSTEILKIPAQRRNNVKLAETWSKHFDIALCPHRVKTV